ncbi:VanZ family protein [Marinobacter mobilis]|uniref:VanZ like family protein n=1 Tax=Marinobacter mobilis TaxID=488533 RepID=A0A1H2Q128_9GAMM|nr:VanZ family protein [Marinobacter mobilis]SDW00876.1 VanZ like family protein [Marinobacter mobilis]
MNALKHQLLGILRYLPLWRLALVLSGLAILYLATTASNELLPPSPSDKLNHLVAFLELSLLARLGWPQARPMTLLTLLAGYGVAIELIQWPLPYREFSFADMAADAVGIALGLALWSRLPPPSANGDNPPYSHQ